MPICKCCNTQFRNTIKIDGVWHNIAKRRYCLSCSPFGKHNTRNIEIPGEIHKEHSCSICGKLCGQRRKKCQACATKAQRHRNKQKAVDYKGGKCVRCGWNGHIAAFQFHHSDPSRKEFGINSIINRRWSIVKQELDKCELLCAICHAIEHATDYD